MRELVRATKALSDETRVRILNLLLAEECCVCEVMEVLGISQTRASRNLAILHRAGFLALRRDGLRAEYSIDRTNLEGYLSLMLGAVRSSLLDDEAAQADRECLQGIVGTGNDTRVTMKPKRDSGKGGNGGEAS